MDDMLRELFYGRVNPYATKYSFDDEWKEVLNSDAPLYGGSGQGNMGNITASPLPVHGRPYSLNMTIPPLGVVVFRPGN